MKKTLNMMWLVAGFLAGMAYLVSCGGGGDGLSRIGESIAQAIVRALDVSYDNSASGLAATTVQGAIDEVADHSISASSLEGTWHGGYYSSSRKGEGGYVLTLNADGSYSCTGPNAPNSYSNIDGGSDICIHPVGWEFLKATMIFTYNDWQGEKNALYRIQYKDAGIMELIAHDDDPHLYLLEKQ